MTLVDIETNPLAQNQVHGRGIGQTYHGLYNQIRSLSVCKNKKKGGKMQKVNVLTSYRVFHIEMDEKKKN